MTETLNTIKLSYDESKLFLKFREHQDLFELLNSIDAWSVRSGSITIHINAEGKVAGVAKEQHFSSKSFHT